MFRAGGRQPTLPLGASSFQHVVRPQRASAQLRWPAAWRRSPKFITAVAILLLLILSVTGMRKPQRRLAGVQAVEQKAAAAMPSDEPQCRFFRQPRRAKGPFTIAVVGDELLSDAYKKEVRGMNCTVRTDSLRNLQPGDPLTMWIIQAPEQDSAVLEAADAADWQQASDSLKATVVIGGQNDTVKALQKKLGVGVAMIHYPSDSWYKTHWLELPAGGRPSTIYIALRMAVQCKTPGAMVHLYGAPPRWRKDPNEAAKKMTEAHTDAEAAIVLKMNRAKITIHETPTKTARQSRL